LLTYILPPFRYRRCARVFGFGCISRRARVPRSQLITPKSRSVACMHGGLAPKRRMHGNDPFGPLIKTWMLAVAFLFSHASNECSVVRRWVNTFARATEDVLVSANSLPTPCITEQREFLWPYHKFWIMNPKRHTPTRRYEPYFYEAVNHKSWTPYHEPSEPLFC